MPDQPTLPPRFPLWRYIDFFGNEYLLSEPEAIDTDYGVCLRARYRLSGTPVWREAGDFDIDKATLIEPVAEQLEIGAAA